MFYVAFLSQRVDDLAPVLHSRSLSGHRRYLEIALLKLRRTYGEEAVGALIGKSTQELNALNDWEFFRFTVGIGAEISQVEPTLHAVPPRVIGEQRDGEIVYVVVALRCSLREAGRRLEMEMPKVLAFAREHDEWKIDSFPFAASVAESLEEELAIAAKAVR